MDYYKRDSQRQESNKGSWPQKWFKDKQCRMCGKTYTPTSPSMCYCSTECEVDGYTDRYLQRNYSVTLKWYRKQHAKQSGLCAICRKEGFVMGAKGQRTKLVVDHCHITGEVRGLLCHNCNRALGLFKDSKESLLTAATYLEGATTIRKE